MRRAGADLRLFPHLRRAAPLGFAKVREGCREPVTGICGPRPGNPRICAATPRGLELAVPPSARGESRGGEVMSKKKILLVDDSSTALMIAQVLLSRSAYQVLLARDGIEAVAKAKAELPDLILMDVVMPNMDGIEACKAIRRDPTTQAIPIILVTTRGDERSIEAGFASGCNDYVTKPINGPELLGKLRDQLGE